MAQGVNKVTLLGFVGKNPEIRSTSGGTLVANFSLATTERYKDRDTFEHEFSHPS
jgi:single-strand DNA-binding protein